MDLERGSHLLVLSQVQAAADSPAVILVAQGHVDAESPSQAANLSRNSTYLSLDDDVLRVVGVWSRYR